MKNAILKHKKISIIVVTILLLSIIAFSYAFFINADITGSNIARTECFKLTLQGSNDINLQDAYPMSEQEGSQLTPYTFTVRNICNTTADYQVNIETLNTSSLDTEYIRVKLDNNASMILKRNELNTTNVNQNVKEGRKIATGTLRSNEEVTYDLRLWIDGDSTKEQSANKEYYGKVTVLATPNNDISDITLAYIVDGVQQDAPPAKGDGYVLKSFECTNADGEWNRIRWGLLVYNISGKAQCNLEFETATEVEAIIYSAAVDEVYYYNDYEEKVILGTTDTTGKLENAILPVREIKLYSTVAKDPSNLSDAYSKDINVVTTTNRVFLMPNDNVLYWWGYNNLGGSSNNGWPVRSAASFKTNYIYTLGPGYSSWTATGTVDKVHVKSKIHAIGQATASYNNNSVYVAVNTSSKSFGTYPIAYGGTTAITHWTGNVAAEDDYYIAVGAAGDPNRGGNTFALWYE